MNAKQKKNFFYLLLIAFLIFLVTIPPNLTGAKNPTMLSVFEIDEYAQYPFLVQMLTSGSSFYQTLRNFFVYLHYFYGFPFYFFSSISVLPIRLAMGSNWVNNISLIMLVLRQMISVLPMLVTVILLVRIQTKFNSLTKSAALFIFLLTISGVARNNFWWHPDSLAILFATLALYFLIEDQLKFGKHFFWAAVAVGLAIGTKQLGWFFFLTIIVYLGYGMVKKVISTGQLLRFGFLFVLLMCVTVVVSNPLLLLPIERGEIIKTQAAQFIVSTQGFYVKNPQYFIGLNRYPEIFRKNYGEWFFLLLPIVGLIIGLFSQEKRLKNIILLSWITPLGFILNRYGSPSFHYFLPVILPLWSSINDLFSIENSHETKHPLKRPKTQHILQLFFLIMIAIQAILFLKTDIIDYINTLNREETSPSIAFYHTIERDYLSLFEKNNLNVFRDRHIYFPPYRSFKVEMSWDPPHYEMIQKIQPDLILLEQEKISSFSSQAIVKKFSPAVRFYSDAKANSLKGYHLLFENDFAKLFVSDAFFYLLSK